MPEIEPILGAMSEVLTATTKVGNYSRVSATSA
jgi:hypothetical protein